jgi:hypothetical protein
VTAKLYGSHSEPPAVDDVWQQLAKSCEVQTFLRSRVTGREKRTDHQLVADLTEVACSVPAHKRGCIVVVGGDADCISALDKALLRPHWRVEVWCWKQSLSAAFHELCDTYPGRGALLLLLCACVSSSCDACVLWRVCAAQLSLSHWTTSRVSSRSPSGR